MIPAMSFTGCGQTLRWHVRGRAIGGWLGIIDNSFRFTLKLWRPTPSGSYTEVRPERSLTSSVHLSSLSARADYRVAFSSGDIPGLSASNLLFLEYTSNPSHGTSVYYWLITTSTLPTTWNPRSHASTVTSQLPLLSIESTYILYTYRGHNTRPLHVHTYFTVHSLAIVIICICVTHLYRKNMHFYVSVQVYIGFPLLSQGLHNVICSG